MTEKRSEKKGSAIPIWFSGPERQRLEEGAALAGYKHLSTYIKDRVFARGDCRTSLDVNGMDSGSDMELATRLDVLMTDQAQVKAMLSFLMLTAARELSSSSKLELVRRLSSAKSEEDVFLSLGDLGKAIEVFGKEIE